MARKRSNRSTKKGLTRLGEWKPRFLDHLARMGNVSRAAKYAGIAIDTVYAHRKSDEAFCAQWRKSLKQAGDELEAEAWRRGMEGVAKPVFHQGEKCGSVQEYSDTLLIFLLKGTRPKKFRDNVKVEHAGKVKHEHGVDPDLSQFSDDELLRFERAFAGRAAGAGTPSQN